MKDIVFRIAVLLARYFRSNCRRHLCRAWPTALGLAILAFVNEVVRPRITQVAVPLNDCGVGLDPCEVVFASVGDGHYESPLSIEHSTLVHGLADSA